MQDYHEFLAEILIDEETLQSRISEIAAEINRDYFGRLSPTKVTSILGEYQKK